MNKISTEIMEKMKKSFELTKMKHYCKINYTASVKAFLNYHRDNIQTIENLDLEMIKAFLSHMLNIRKLKIGTVNNYRSALKYLFEFVLKKEWCNKQIPCLSGYKTLPTVLSKSAVMKLVNVSENLMFSTLFLTIFASGLRIDEALSLSISDIDSDQMQVNVCQSKNGSSRKAILSQKNLEALRYYLKTWWIPKFGKCEKEDYLFCITRKNIKIPYATVLKSFRKAAILAKLPSTATIHSLRHGFATFLLEKNAPIVTLKELLGHRSLRSTMIYTKLANYSAMGIKSPLDYDDGEVIPHCILSTRTPSEEMEEN